MTDTLHRGVRFQARGARDWVAYKGDRYVGVITAFWAGEADEQRFGAVPANAPLPHGAPLFATWRNAADCIVEHSFVLFGTAERPW